MHTVTFFALQLSALLSQQNDFTASRKEQVAKMIFWTP